MLIKQAVFFTFLALSTSAFSQSEEFPNFEAELRAIETSQLKSEELQMRNVDAVSDVISDEVATGQAATLRAPPPQNEKKSTEEKKTLNKVRRIRSR